MKNKLGLISMISFVVILVSFALFAIPGQFIMLYGFNSSVPGTSLAGYEYFFHIIQGIGDSGTNQWFADGRPSATGIMIVIFLGLALPCFFFNKKSTALPLLGGILEILAGFFLLMTNPFSHLIYKKLGTLGASWVPYLTGSLILLLGIAALFASIAELKKEKVVLESKGGYSYLKK